MSSQSISWYRSQAFEEFSKLILTAILIISALIYSLRPIFNRFFFVPSPTYKNKLLKVFKSNNSIKRITSKKFGLKLGSYRRRVVIGAKTPSTYSTNDENYKSIIFQDEDLEDRESFFSRMSARNVDASDRVLIYGFFHPYCNAGGGGERVLWQAVYNTLKASKNNVVAIYTADTKEATPKEIMTNVLKRFNLEMDNNRIVFIHLSKRHLVDGSYWKKWTLLGQAIGSIILAFEAVLALPPDCWVDTMGYPFAYPFINYFLKIPILSYTHFPVIQSDMLNKLVVQFQNTNGILIKSKIVGKYVYWKFFLLAYSLVGNYIDVPLCNGTWTYNHLNKIWWTINGEKRREGEVKMNILYPPCSTESLVTEEGSEREDIFLCLAQFRPEKRHSIIIKEYAKFLNNCNRESRPKLVLIGSIRGDQDREFVSSLKSLAESLKIESHVEFILDAPFSTVKEYFRKSKFGINAMWNEHFGIAVVETIASGLIPISHASAGPYLDIAVPWDLKTEKQLSISKTNETNRTGFFFKHEEDPDYEDSFKGKFHELHEVFTQVMKLNDKEINDIRTRGKRCVLKKFSNKSFDDNWNKYVDKLNQYEELLRSERGKVTQLY